MKKKKVTSTQMTAVDQTHIEVKFTIEKFKAQSKTSLKRGFNVVQRQR